MWRIPAVRNPNYQDVSTIFYADRLNINMREPWFKTRSHDMLETQYFGVNVVELHSQQVSRHPFASFDPKK